ncbi:LysR family transcriptional regulator [Erythrobacter sp.]|uniref:LysR family transcriptional regulator n=1 Tax=Erythrobacter sp. TaxID=1042 RepID=UPI001B148F51|nr:LysR family transcriptional regulator [Erythrobacter sp.]MBO6527562.1 LysR family transcriptional regulator [Erythrobacter sp.]MBO6530242.1 LysR family transcriptional regulator [Erythrobacter sp.]
MHKLDLNLLHALSALLQEESVVAASRRLGITPSATSRALARLRDVTGDPLLVRAGRRLVLSPRAAELKQQLPQVMDQVRSLLGPNSSFDLTAMERVFAIRCREGFAETFGPLLIETISKVAPRSRLTFLQKTDKSSSMLRDGSVDLETGVLSGRIGPEVRSRRLFEDRYVTVTSCGHPTASQQIDTEALCQFGYVGLYREEAEEHFVENAMRRAGIEQAPSAIVASYGAAIALARQSELIALVPRIHTQGLQAGVAVTELPFEASPFSISLLWHPRLDADPAHRWLRSVVVETVTVRARQLQPRERHQENEKSNR